MAAIGGAGMTSALSTELVDSGARFAALRATWAALHDESVAGPFLSWEWQYASWRRVTPGRALRLMVARGAAGGLAGVLALSEEQRGFGARVWRFLGDRTIGSDYLDCLTSRGAEEEVGRALWRAVFAQPGFDALEILDVAEDSPSRETIRLLAAERGWFHDETPRYRCPGLALGGAPGSPGAYKHPRAENLRRRRRWLEQQPGYHIDVVDSPASLARPLAEFLLLHRLRWAPAGGSEAITGPDIESFHRDATHLLGERGMVRFYTLRLGDRPLASMYLLRRGTYRAMYQSAYDPQFAARSPGLVLLARSIDDAVAEGATEYDFLRGAEAYKLEWANRERRTVAIRIARPSPAGAAYLATETAIAAGRLAAKRLLPAACVAAVRETRRWVSAR